MAKEPEPVIKGIKNDGGKDTPKPKPKPSNQSKD